MNIGFTGHRDRSVDVSYLAKIYEKYPDSLWVHGGAQGFDAQVDGFAREMGITAKVIKPDYAAGGRRAPLDRNDIMLSLVDFLVACYDGRIGGGTYYTVRQARKLGIPVMILQPKERT